MVFHLPNNVKNNTALFSQRFRVVFLFIIFILALALRLYNITAAPLDYHATRQYRSVIIAHALYYENLNNTAQWERQVAAINKDSEGDKEPLIMEHLSVLGYRFFGEQFWIPKLLSITFWFVGGIFLFLIAREISSPDAAVFSVCFYLFLPFGIGLSRCFMPEPLMIMMFLASVYFQICYFRSPTARRMLLAAVFSGLAIMIKFVVIFPLFGVFVAMGIFKQGWRKFMFEPKTISWSFLTMGIGITYYIYTMLTTPRLSIVAGTIFFPHLLLTSFFWLGWLREICNVVGAIPLLISIIGFLMLKKQNGKIMLIGLFSGYFIYALIFSYTTATHDHYHVSLYPIVVLALGPPVCWLVKKIKRISLLHKLIGAMISIIFLLSAILWLQQLDWINMNKSSKNNFKLAGRLTVGNQPLHMLFQPEIYKARLSEQIGQAVKHSKKTIFLTFNSGKPLMYHGQLCGVNWPHSNAIKKRRVRGIPILSTEQMFLEMVKKNNPEYFIITDLIEFELQEDLKKLLTCGYPVLIKNNNFLIFDLRRQL